MPLFFVHAQISIHIINYVEISKVLWRFMLLKSKVKRPYTDIITKGFYFKNNITPLNFAL